MGLDVGVIPSPIKYLGRPENDVYDFVWHLNLHADDGNWNVYSAGNTIVEYERENLERQMEEYIDATDLTRETTSKIRSWVHALPWDGNHIMLHFGW